MEFSHVLQLLGGLALFLYGMQMMSAGLEHIAGSRMKSILEKLTSNRFLGVGVGAGITAVIQSSSATTVMVVGFVNTGIMTLRQAVWVIMGANIGTTVTGLLISLDVGALAPLVAFLGVAAIMFLKAPKWRHAGSILAGFGVLFIGMDMMGAAMQPLRSSQLFLDLMTEFSNPLLGILVGAVFTAVIQSSSAAIGILQTLALSGLIPLESAVFVLFGMNIGTCITALLASLGANRAAKRTTLIHLLFNIAGTALFTALTLLLPVTEAVRALVPDNPSAQIAGMHILFNAVTTALLLPFGTQLARLAERVLPDKAAPGARVPLAEKLRRSSHALGSAAIQRDLLRGEIVYMLGLARENVERCFNAVLGRDASQLDRLEAVEEELDLLNKEISSYISQTLVDNQSGDAVADTEEYFLISGNAERIGDHANNIGGYVRVLERDDARFSGAALGEIARMKELTLRALDKVLRPGDDREEWLSEVAAMEQQMDDMTDACRETHLGRMRRGECSQEACILFSELLTDFERIGDHVLNIAQAYAKTFAREK